MKRIAAVFVALVLVAGGGLALAVDDPPQGATCDGGTLLQTVTGSFTRAEQGAYVMVPFMVPSGTTRVRVKLSHDQIAFPNPVTKHTLDLGMYEATDPGDGFWDANEFRGWGGSSRLNQCVSAHEATLGFRPGPIPAGEWAAEIGVAAVAGPAEGDPDGRVNWTLEVYLDTADQGPPWTPTPYDTTPANPNPGWYAGDFHVHGEHSNPADASTRQVLDYAFRPSSQLGGGADLDFITLSDYVTDRHWDEVGHYQADYPGKLIVRSSEVITYRGHIINHASLNQVDHRTGPVYERLADGTLDLIRGARLASDVFDDIHVGGQGWAQVAHPTTFPSTVPGFANFCRGCSWEYSDEETSWNKVDAMEVQTGPAGTGEYIQGQRVGQDGTLGPNPFTPLAIEWFDRLQRQGYDVTAVGASDSHKAGAHDLLSAPIGEGQTVVYANELSEAGIRDGIRAGHAYVKMFGSHGPDLRFTARPIGGGARVMMGDELTATAVKFSATVIGAATGPGALTLHVFRDGVPILAFPVPNDSADDEHTVKFVGVAPGDYRLQLQRGTAIEALTNPINVTLPTLP